jgi:hypothetical protein
MYHDDSSPQDQAADATMTALYRQLDDHDLPGDAPLDTAAGLRDLTGRIQAESSHASQSAHVGREHGRLRVSAHGTAGRHIGRPDREFSLNEETSVEVVEGEIIDDMPASEPIPLVPEDTILTPCHPRCTCGLHTQVVYGDRVPLHTPSELDNGEMALLTRAAEDATRLLNDSNDHLRKLRAAAVRTHWQAGRALRELTLLLGSDTAGRARAQRNQVEAAYADLTPAERQPAPRWLKMLVYNPYQADLRRAERALARLRKRIAAQADAVTGALSAHEIAWRDLRSARDELISSVLAELARPWQTVILPARLQHGKAGPTAVRPECEVTIEMPTVTAVDGGHDGADLVKITYQLFEGIPQPQPGPGPLAEVIRTLLDFSPEPLRAQQRRLEQSLLAQLGEGKAPLEDPADSRSGWLR